jgi:hypothetical protein
VCKSQRLVVGRRKKDIMASCCLADGVPHRQLVLPLPFIMRHQLVFLRKSPSEIHGHMQIAVAFLQRIILEIGIKIVLRTIYTVFVV